MFLHDGMVGGSRLQIYSHFLRSQFLLSLFSTTANWTRLELELLTEDEEKAAEYRE
jgi:hypothetical protein